MVCAHIAKDLLDSSGGFFDRKRLYVVDAEVGDLASHGIAEPGNEGTVLKNQKLSRNVVAARLERISQRIGGTHRVYVGNVGLPHDDFAGRNEKRIPDGLR